MRKIFSKADKKKVKQLGENTEQIPTIQNVRPILDSVSLLTVYSFALTLLNSHPELTSAYSRDQIGRSDP